MKEASSHTSSSLTGTLKPITFLSEKQNRQKTSDLKTFHQNLWQSPFSTWASYISVLYQSFRGGKDWKQFVAWPFSDDIGLFVLCVKEWGEKTDADHQNILNPLKGNIVSISSKKPVHTQHEWSLSFAACCNWLSPTRLTVVCFRTLALLLLSHHKHTPHKFDILQLNNR